MTCSNEKLKDIYIYKYKSNYKSFLCIYNKIVTEQYLVLQ